ncbi:hypothetical protein HHX47_DHR3000359 [Lentinula edodes]|nr:hypothetical protein HHX47_DHR3000359 [Lentinula edodes]
MKGFGWTRDVFLTSPCTAERNFQGYGRKDRWTITSPPIKAILIMTDPEVQNINAKSSFAEERLGWTGYVEWEQYPEKKALASKVLAASKFTPIPEFQFVPLPTTNPVLIGHRWKEYHDVLGLKSIVDFSWETVQREKPDLLHLLDFPYNGETKRDQLLQGKLTDNKYHFVRNHGGVPNINENDYELEIAGLVNKPIKISLKDLKDPEKFPGTAVYRGVPLKKVLKLACGGVLPECEHLEFIGADTYFKKNNVFNYAVSVPLRKVRASSGTEVLLAWEMNGAPLPKIHGAPLRLVVAGYIGARSCKWVYKINALKEPSMGPVQRQEYLYYTPQHYYAWRLWKFDLPVDAEGWLELCVRTWDSSNNTEPTFVRSAWNWDLHVTSSAHRIKVYSINTSRPATAQRLRELEAHGQGIEKQSLSHPAEFTLEPEQDYLEKYRQYPREPTD